MCGKLGRKSLIAPGTATVDFSLFKSFNVTEEGRIQFRGEFFNLFNRPNFGSPDTTPWNASGVRDVNAGVISSTRGGPRQAQLAVKYIF